MAGIRCGNCNTLNREGAKFCASCGAKLEVYTPPPPSWNVPPQSAPEPSHAPTFQSEPAQQPVKTSWLHLTANLLAWICGAAFVVLVCLALPILNASGRILNGSLYKEALQKQAVYKNFPDLFAEQMVLSQPSLAKEARINFSGVVIADWKLIAQELVTPTWMQTQVESLIDQIFAATKAGSTPPALKISLNEVTQRLSGDSGFNIYKKVIQTKRECGLDDLFEIIGWLDKDPSSNLPICNIPTDLADFAAEIGGYSNGDAMIKDILKDLPDKLPKEIALSEFFTLHMDRVGKSMSLGRGIAWVSLALAGLALLVTFLSPMGRTLKGWLLLWGVPLAITGLICLIVAFLMPLALSLLISGAFKGSIATGLQKVILEVSNYVFKPGATAQGIQAVGMLLVGLVMAGASILLWGVGKYRATR